MECYRALDTSRRTLLIITSKFDNRIGIPVHMSHWHYVGHMQWHATKCPSWTWHLI